MKSILILGAAALQMPLIEHVKRQGFRAIVVSIPGNYPGFAIADKTILRDVRDVTGILNDAAGEDIAAVVTDQTDISVPTVAAIAQRLGLPGNAPHTAAIYANKFLMRQVCRQVGVAVPQFLRVTTPADVLSKSDSGLFPAIMKPEDNQGSRGIFYVSNADDVVAHLDEALQFSKTGHVIVEKFFKGREVVVEGYVENGRYLNWGIAERRYFDIENCFIPCQTLFPALIPEGIRTTLLAAEQRLHSHLKPAFGMIHSEYLIDENSGEYILVETALRGGGVYISSHLVPLYTGIDNYALLIDHSLGRTRSLEEADSGRHEAASAYLCFYLPEGVIEHVSGITAVKNHPNVVLADLDGLTIGTHTHAMSNKTHRLGPIIVKGKNRKELDDTIAQVQQTLNVRVRTAEGLDENIRWN